VPTDRAQTGKRLAMKTKIIEPATKITKPAKRLTLTKQSLKNLTVRTGVRAGRTFHSITIGIGC
jgi:hypothetical protein